MDKSTHQMRCNYWLTQIEACAQSGKNKTAWCRENGISDKTFFYWQRVLRNESYLSSLEARKGINDPLTPFIELPAIVAKASTDLAVNDANSKLYDTISGASNDIAASISIGKASINLYSNASPSFIKNLLEVIAHAE